MGEIKSNPQVYTTQEGTKNWIHINLYQETALCLDSFFWLKFEVSIVNLYIYYPLLVPECRCQARLFLTDKNLCNFPWFFDWRHFPPKVYGRERFGLPHQQQDYILRPRESICWNSPCLISPEQRPIEDIRKCCLVTWGWTNSLCSRAWDLLAGQNVLYSTLVTEI